MNRAPPASRRRGATEHLYCRLFVLRHAKTLYDKPIGGGVALAAGQQDALAGR